MRTAHTKERKERGFLTCCSTSWPSSLWYKNPLTLVSSTAKVFRAVCMLEECRREDERAIVKGGVYCRRGGKTSDVIFQDIGTSIRVRSVFSCREHQAERAGNACSLPVVTSALPHELSHIAVSDCVGDGSTSHLKRDFSVFNPHNVSMPLPGGSYLTDKRGE